MAQKTVEVGLSNGIFLLMALPPLLERRGMKAQKRFDYRAGRFANEKHSVRG
jgi:hypothetical protein